MDTYQDDDMGRYWAAESAAAHLQQEYYHGHPEPDWNGIFSESSRESYGSYGMTDPMSQETQRLSQPASQEPPNDYSRHHLALLTHAANAHASNVARVDLEQRYEIVSRELHAKLAGLKDCCPRTMFAIEVANMEALGHALQAISDPAARIAQIQLKIDNLDELLKVWQRKPVAQVEINWKLDQKMRKETQPFRRLKDDDKRFELPTLVVPNPEPRKPIPGGRKRSRPTRPVKARAQSHRADPKEVFSFFVHFLRHCGEHGIGGTLSVCHLTHQWEKHYPEQKMDSRMFGIGQNGDKTGKYATPQRFSLQDVLDTAKKEWPKILDEKAIALLQCMKSQHKRKERAKAAERQVKGGGGDNAAAGAAEAAAAAAADTIVAKTGGGGSEHALDGRDAPIAAGCGCGGGGAAAAAAASVAAAPGGGGVVSPAVDERQQAAAAATDAHIDGDRGGSTVDDESAKDVPIAADQAQQPQDQRGVQGGESVGGRVGGEPWPCFSAVSVYLSFLQALPIVLDASATAQPYGGLSHLVLTGY